jgi:eukaryotic-like serine/threonine-protein kinase
MSSSQLPDPWLGRFVGERQRYRLDKRLGAGGTAEVFLAMDTLLGQPVALKLLNEKLAAGEMRRRFEQEAALCAALRSNHIVQVSDHGVTPEGNPFFVMEYLHGQTLRQLLNQEKQLSVERTISIVAQVCQGLHLAHQGVELWHPEENTSRQVKIVHRDLKPDNIFLVPMMLGELVKILDFGIAKIRSTQTEVANLTTQFIGTYRYAAPEQFEIGKDLDERADIYGLGMILYEMLSGTDPFGFGRSTSYISAGTWAVAHLSTSPKPLQDQPNCDHLPPELAAVVMRCLEKDPDQRFASVSELSAALHAAVNQTAQPLTAFPNPAPQPTSTIDATYPLLSLDGKPTLNDRQTVSDGQLTHAQTATAAQTATIYQTRSKRKKSDPVQPVPNASVFFYKSVLLQTIGVIVAGLGLYYVVQPLILPLPSATSPQPEHSVALVNPSTAEHFKAKSLTGHSDTVWAVTVSPDGKTLASGSFDKTVRLWTSAGELQQIISGHTDAVRAVAISADGQTLASGSSDKTIKIWDLQTGELLHTLTGHRGPIWSVAFTPDGQTLASGSYDGTIKIWDLQSGTLLRTLPEHYDSVWTVTISPDGQTLASGSYDGTIKIWDLQSGTLLRSLVGHTEAVRSTAISQDGAILASGSWDKTIKLWNWQTGELLHTLTGHADRVVSVTLDPTGETVASGSLDRTIKIWHLQTGQLLRTLPGHTDWVISVAFSPDGKTIISGSKDKTVRIWQ